MKKYLFFTLTFTSVMLFAQNNIRRVAAVGFYNVENLWDTQKSADYIDGTKDVSNPAFHRSIPVDSIQYLEHEPYKGQWSDELLKGKKAVRYQYGSDEFTPQSAKNYNEKTYQKKLNNIAQVISEIGSKYTKTAPAVVGLVEVENRQVVEALVQQPQLAKYNYGVVHFNSYDGRGIDNALIYQKGRFKLEKAWKKELKIFDNGKREYTRDLLVAIGELDGEKFAFFVNHWPSRRGGEAISLPKRNAAAALLNQQMDSIRKNYPEYKLMAMGDFNDDPVSPSFKNYVKATGDINKVDEETPYFNPMYKMFKNGVASLAYQDAPNLFDQIIYSKNLIGDKERSAQNTYTIYTTEVYAPAYLITKEGSYKGYPFRSWSGDRFTDGYSDHFPVFSILQKSAQ
ncbi:endonuclease [Elizabethkingia meningoseptica]|uniref:endonuclease/exonuclease/phosphatase family protein n=1 Tax=Elizabethkingia meningoseptica TaxID=238 RepID=UPI0023B1DC54|nr:endonuclease [Elizabethkingia meningoseptica]MDE5438255.1 endonuclease [Elizabethkingia meningoseptica]MDE5508798.1 endonuclease [Elizabethkingia meningoseptica]MDE5515743.1 endonuclease [Elizabethkingia meningoseptica]MDE5527181.1 endonuclease [Elizabethkingia meningoseptica]MDE5530159.1 endonuclease [Elizabethkingia meningoseptica]